MHQYCCCKDSTNALQDSAAIGGTEASRGHRVLLTGATSLAECDSLVKSASRFVYQVSLLKVKYARLEAMHMDLVRGVSACMPSGTECAHLQQARHRAKRVQSTQVQASFELHARLQNESDWCPPEQSFAKNVRHGTALPSSRACPVQIEI